MRYSLVILIALSSLTNVFAQAPANPELVDWFGPIDNDSLQARVLRFQDQLEKDGATGLVILSGPRLSKYFNQRRIIGCNLFTRMPQERLRFRFTEDQTEPKFEFWEIPKGVVSPRFAPSELDYKINLAEPIEMTVSMASDEFCPRYFQLSWYAKFLIANPRVTGKAVIDVPTKGEFLLRVTKYRKELLSYGVSRDRMRYYHKHFQGEHDEQFWLVPPKLN